MNMGLAPGEGLLFSRLITGHLPISRVQGRGIRLRELIKSIYEILHLLGLIRRQAAELLKEPIFVGGAGGHGVLQVRRNYGTQMYIVGDRLSTSASSSMRSAHCKRA